MSNSELLSDSYLSSQSRIEVLGCLFFSAPTPSARRGAGRVSRTVTVRRASLASSTKWLKAGQQVSSKGYKLHYTVLPEQRMFRSRLQVSASTSPNYGPRLTHDEDLRNLCSVIALYHSLAGQTLLRGERVWSNSHHHLVSNTPRISWRVN